MLGNERICAVVQARMGSTRLPGKVLMPLAGRPVLWHVLRRLEALPILDEIVVATSECGSDDPIEVAVGHWSFRSVRLFRGPHEDVLSRFYQALSQEPPDVVARITADSPLVSITHLETMARTLVDAGLDGIDAHHERTGLTLGLGSEVYTYRALVDAHLLAATPEEREHVTLFIKRRPQAFRIDYPAPKPALCTSLRLTLDYAQDYRLLHRLYEALYEPDKGVVDCGEALQWLASRPEVASINGDCHQRSA